MQSTAERILAQWHGYKKQRDGTYRGNCPYRSESDSFGFVLRIEDGEHGAYTDHSSNESGSLYDLASKMGIELPEGGRHKVENTKTAYVDLADYAQRHYAPVDAFIAAKWEFVTHNKRPALRYPTQSGIRARFIDDKADKSPYIWIGENAGNCWYGLEKAINLANAISSPIVLCNGEASTVVAQWHGVPAFCGTGGEGSVSDAMLQDLHNRWNGQVLIALDCDSQGENASQKLAPLIEKSIVIDLGLSKKGDLADFCGIHGKTALDALQKLSRQTLDKMIVENSEFIDFVDNYSLLSVFSKFVWESPELFGRVIEMPFEGMRRAGGFADLMTTKKIWFLGNVSGGGKTIMSETLCDGWNKLGSNVFYIGDEWTEMEFIARQIQRATIGQAVTYMDYLHYVKGTRELSYDELDKIAFASRAIRERQGRTYVMKVNREFRNVVFLEDIMEAMARKIEVLRMNGTQVDIIVLDYLSLYDTKSDNAGNNVEEYKAGIFKSWCKSLDVLGVSTVQVNKSSEDRVIQKGGFLTQHDLHWIRPDKGNLISTMNRIYCSNFEMRPESDKNDPHRFRPYLDENGSPLPTPNLCIVTAKNSVSSPHEYSYFHFDFTHMVIREGLHPDYHYDTQHHVILPNNHAKAQKSARIQEHYAND